MATEYQTQSSGQDPQLVQYSNRKMFVGGLSPNTTDSKLKSQINFLDSLRAYFEQYGELVDVVIMRDKNTNTSRGFGFVTFAKSVVAQQILRLQPHIIDGKQVECKIAVPKEQQPQPQVYNQQQAYQQNQGSNDSSGKNKKNPQNANHQGKGPKQKNQQSSQYQKQLQKQMQMIEEQRQQIEMLQRQHTEYQKHQQQSQNRQNFQTQQQQPMQYHQQDGASQVHNQQRQEPQKQKDLPIKQEFKFQDYTNNSNSGSNEGSYIKLGSDDNSPQVSQNNNFKFQETTSSSQSDKSQSSEPYQPVANLDPQYRKIFVGGLPHNLGDAEFRDYFIKFGEIEDCAILKDKRTGKPRGFGFVTYKNIEVVNQVMEIKDKHTIQGKWVDCKRAVPVNQMKEGVVENKSASKEITLGNGLNGGQNYQSHPQINLMNDFTSINKQQPPMQFMGNQGISLSHPQPGYQPSQQQPMYQRQGSSISPNSGEYSNVSQTQSPDQTTFNSQSQPFFKPQPKINQGSNDVTNNFQQQMASPNQISFQPPPGLSPNQTQQQQQPYGQPYQQYMPYMQQQNTYGMNAGGYQPTGYQPMQYNPQRQSPPNPQPTYDMSNFKSGYPYSQTFKMQQQQQQMLHQQQQQYPQETQNRQQAQFNFQNQPEPQVNQMNEKEQQESTEWHIQSINKQYSNFNLEEDNSSQEENKVKNGEEKKVKCEKQRQETIQILNAQIEKIESRDSYDEEEKTTTSKVNSVNWKQQDNNISGFYTQHTSSMDDNALTPKNVDYQPSASSSLSRSSINLNQVNSKETQDQLKPTTPLKNDSIPYGTTQPQEEVRNESNEVLELNPPQNKRVESEGRISAQDQQYAERRHVLGSGKNFSFGKDRPSSRNSNDRVKPKAEYGQIKSQQTQGPSHRADRTYKPY